MSPKSQTLAHCLGTKSKKTGPVRRVEKFATPSQDQFDVWWQSLKAIKQKVESTTQAQYTLPEEDVAASLGLEPPPLLPGETITCGIQATGVAFSQRENATWASAMCWITNFCIYFYVGTPKKSTESKTFFQQLEKVITYNCCPIASLFRIDSLPPKNDLDYVGLHMRDFRRLFLRWPIASESKAKFLSRVWNFHPQKNIFKNLYACRLQTFMPKPSRLQVSGTAGLYYYYNPILEFSRQGLPNEKWQVNGSNSNYTLSPTYPQLLVVPSQITDEELIAVASYRTKKRLPALSYHHSNGAVIVRSSQPKRGVTGSTCSEDKLYMSLVAQSSKNLVIYDARSKVAATANRGIGGGEKVEDEGGKYRVIFLGIDNIHAVRSSCFALGKLCLELMGEDTFQMKIWETGWHTHLYRILQGAQTIVRDIITGVSCLVHCSDGWDRTTQLTSLATLLLDPYYRTFVGFQVLIEKEWLSFGHQFSTRHGFNNDETQEAPIFLQFLECVYHIQRVYPTAFQFNEEFLVEIFDHIYTAAFGTFLHNHEQSRLKEKAFDKTVSMWAYFESTRASWLNPIYSAVEKPLTNEVVDGRHLTVWNKVFFRWDEGVLAQQNLTDAYTRALVKQNEELRNALSKAEAKLASLAGNDQQPTPPTQETNNLKWSGLSVKSLTRNESSSQFLKNNRQTTILKLPILDSEEKEVDLTKTNSGKMPLSSPTSEASSTPEKWVESSPKAHSLPQGGGIDLTGSSSAKMLSPRSPRARLANTIVATPTPSPTPQPTRARSTSVPSESNTEMPPTRPKNPPKDDTPPLAKSTGALTGSKAPDKPIKWSRSARNLLEPKKQSIEPEEKSLSSTSNPDFKKESKT